MRVIIVGCGRTGSRLAVHLARDQHEVTVIDSNREAFLRLSPDFPGRTVHGSGLDYQTLEQAGARDAELLIALTGGDNRNLFTAQLARQRLDTPRVLARLHDPVRAAKYRELGVETICTTTVLSGLVELYVQNGEFPALPGDVRTGGDASALEVSG